MSREVINSVRSMVHGLRRGYLSANGQVGEGFSIEDVREPYDKGYIQATLDITDALILMKEELNE